MICPASLKLNWRREIRLVDPDAVVEVICAKDGPPEGTPRWVIVNYDLLTKNAARLHDIPWSGVILDEVPSSRMPARGSTRLTLSTLLNCMIICQVCSITPTRR